MTFEEDSEKISVRACGKLRNIDFAGSEPYSLEYDIFDDRLCITASADGGAELLLPVVCGPDEHFTLESERCLLERGSGAIEIRSDSALYVRTIGAANGAAEGCARNFSVIGGFGTLPLCARLTDGESVHIEIRIKAE